MSRDVLVVGINRYQHLPALKAPALDAEAIAQREQWRCVRCSRGYFEVIEFWLENTVLLELATPELAQQYTAVLTPENLAQLVTQS